MIGMEIRGTTQVLGILGDPVAHSLSPVMQNGALGQAGLDAVYVPFHVLPSELGAAVEGLRALQVLGVNVTVPHKEAVCAFLDELDVDARLIGAVNTIVNRDGKLIGYNTDGRGFIRSLAEDLDFDPRGRRIMLLGAGGACRAAVVALARAGVKWIGIANRTPERAQGLCRDFSSVLAGVEFADFSLSGSELKAALRGVDLLVNTSAMGLKGEKVNPELVISLQKTAVVYDMVYAENGCTPFLDLAKKHGIRGADGRGMLVGQGEEAYSIWTGQQPPRGVMKKRIFGNPQE